MACTIYIGCKMTGRDKREMLDRALLITRYFESYGFRVIHPALEEGVKYEPGALEVNSVEELRGNWIRDKAAIRKADVILFDAGPENSVGMVREYGFSRYGLWKPTIVLWDKPKGITVAEFEDDAIVYSWLTAANAALKFFTRWQRWAWRIKMLSASLPRWILDQILAWK